MNSACGPFTKNKEIIQKSKETRDSRYIYQNKLDKACFQHDIAYRDFKDLLRRTTSDKVLCDKAFNLAKNPKYDINADLLQWFIIFLIESLQVMLLKLKLCHTKNLKQNYTSQLLENLKKVRYTLLLKTIFEVLIFRYAIKMSI